MQLLTLTPSPLDLSPWSVDISSPYNESVVAQLKAMPGLKWDKSRRVWYGDREAALIVAETLEAAKVVKVVNNLTPAIMLPPVRAAEATPFGAPIKLSPLAPTLREYQIEGAAWLVTLLRSVGGALLADQMGIGKSAQAIAAADVIGGTTIVICPAVVTKHWEKQILRWSSRPPESWQVHSYEKFRKAVKDGTVTGPESPTPLCVVVDECHYIANPKALRSKAVAAYCHLHPECKRIFLSGTPMTDKPNDLWHTLDVMHPGRWGSKWQFEKRYCNGHFKEIPYTDPPKTFWTTCGASRAEELNRRLKAVMLRRTMDEVKLELPPRTRNIIEIELPKSVTRDLSKATSALAEDGRLIGVSELLSEVEIHKVDAAVELIEGIIASGGRALVLTTRKATAQAIGDIFDASVVDGETPANKRQEILADATVGVATMYSVQEGIDLVGFDNVVFVGFDWIPKVMLQAGARAYRIGQTRHVTEHYLVGLDTLDEVVRDRVIERLDTFEAVLGSEGSNMKEEISGLEEDILAGIVARVSGKKRARKKAIMAREL